MLAFFLGMTLLIYNFISMLTLISNTDLRQSDYQKTQEFATTMSNRLEDLIGIGLKGKDWMGYQYSYSQMPEWRQIQSYPNGGRLVTQVP